MPERRSGNGVRCVFGQGNDRERWLDEFLFTFRMSREGVRGKRCGLAIRGARHPVPLSLRREVGETSAVVSRFRGPGVIARVRG